jgi:hypothetical protein
VSAATWIFSRKEARMQKKIASVIGRATGTDVHVVLMEDAPEGLRDRVVAEGEPL